MCMCKGVWAQGAVNVFLKEIYGFDDDRPLTNTISCPMKIYVYVYTNISYTLNIEICKWKALECRWCYADVCTDKAATQSKVSVLLCHFDFVVHI